MAMRKVDEGRTRGKYTAEYTQREALRLRAEAVKKGRVTARTGASGTTARRT